MSTHSAFLSTQYLLNVLRPQFDSDLWNKEAQNVNWDDFAVRAIAFGLAPQLHRRLQALALIVPAKASAKLAITYKAQARRNEAIYEQLGQVLSACSAIGLEPICLKGIHLAAQYYAEPALRPMNDIDLLFSPVELPLAESLLNDLGYSAKYKSAEKGARVTKHTSTFRREEMPLTNKQTPNPYLSAGLDRTVEPHVSLEESWFGLKANITPGIRQRTETAVLANRSCRVLNPEDLLHHICLHFCFHLIQGAPAFVQLTDILVIASAKKVDWPIFLARVAEAETACYVLAALGLAQKLIGAPVPLEVQSQLAQMTPHSMQRRIDSLDLRYVLRRTQQKPLNSLGERLRRGWQDRMEIARWAPTLAGKMRVWQTAVQFTRTDTAQNWRR